MGVINLMISCRVWNLLFDRKFMEEYYDFLLSLLYSEIINLEPDLIKAGGLQALQCTE